MKIAETKLWMVTSPGKKKRLTIVLGKPCRKKGVAMCPVAMRGLYPKIHDIIADDTWGALLLAIDFVRLTLILWAKKGFKYTFPDGSSLDPETIWFRDPKKSSVVRKLRARRC